MMEFQFEIDSEEHEGMVTYSLSENSFNYTINYSADIVVLVQYLNLAISSDTMELKYVWGPSYRSLWEITNLTDPVAHRGKIRLLKDNMDDIGTYRLNEADSWKSYFDRESGWFCIGRSCLGKKDFCIEFASNCIAVICEGKLVAIWMRPAFQE